jgi:catechol 2,3-dioxygenase-like lactoylglutathione lyase family enzyme
MKLTAILHTTFLSADLARSRAFYGDLLGLAEDAKRPVMSFDGIWYVVTSTQQIHLMLLPNPEVGLKRAAHGGRDRHVAYGVSDIAELRTRLIAAHIKFTESSTGRAALFCRDPDDNALEFIEE